MKQLLTRACDFLYYKLTGVRVWNIRVVHEEMSGALQAASRIAKKNVKVAKEKNWQELYPESSINNDTKELGQLFEKYGSDKSTRHNYYQIYGDVLKNRRNDNLAILEVGLGKPSVSVKSSCASSQAFRDWAPNAKIYGADIETSLLYEEDRIKTYFVDQTKPETLAELATQLPENFDLIIDDGLHSPWSNFNTIEFALSLLKEDGVMVIEDILKRHEYYWPVLIAALEPTHTCQFVRMKYQCVCIIKNNS